MGQKLDARTTLIYKPVKCELSQVEKTLGKLSTGSPDQLAVLLDYVLNASGKRIRPAITLLSANLQCQGSEPSLLMATAVELLHIATLVHDDTVDNASLRHGKATVSKMWDRNVALLLGDYIFASSGCFVADTDNLRVMRRFSETIQELASGELLEYLNAYNWRQTRADYEDRIYRKTASLFRTASESGATLTGASEVIIESLREYGRNIGMAFQVIDDMLDVQGDPNKVGKPVGNDLVQGIVTLPAILLVEKYPEDNPIQKLFEDGGQEIHLKRTLEMIQNSDIANYCYDTARNYCLKAIQSIKTLPSSAPKSSLEDLAVYITERKL